MTEDARLQLFESSADTSCKLRQFVLAEKHQEKKNDQNYFRGAKSKHKCG